MKLRNKKSGEIIEFGGERIELTEFYEEHGGGVKSVYTYKSLAELNDEWEDYKPKEPLIKDEKIRKAVRAWADALGTDEVSYNSCAEYSEGRFETEMGMADIDFGRVLDLKDGSHTIAELCGEEE